MLKRRPSAALRLPVIEDILAALHGERRSNVLSERIQSRHACDVAFRIQKHIVRFRMLCRSAAQVLHVNPRETFLDRTKQNIAVILFRQAWGLRELPSVT